MDAIHRRDRFVGLMMGLYVGDCLGKPLRGKNRFQIEKKYGNLEALVQGDWKDLRPGVLSFHGATAAAAAGSLRANRGVEPLDLVCRVTQAANGQAIPQSADVLDLFRKLAEDPEAAPRISSEYWAATGGTFADNGAMARGLMVIPVNRYDMPVLWRDTILTTRLTHADPRAIEASLVLNFIAYQVLHRRFEDDLTRESASLLLALRKEPDYQNNVFTFDGRALREAAAGRPEASYLEAPDAVLDVLLRFESLTEEDLATSGACEHTLAVACYALLRAESFAHGLQIALRVGGETAAQGAIAGALLGARFGLREIPPQWLRVLKQQAQLATLAETFFTEGEREQA